MVAERRAARHLVLPGAAAAALLAATVAFADEATPVAPVEGAIAAPVVTDPGADGMVVYVDPRTGKLSSEPAPGSTPLVLPPETQSALSTSGEGLTQTPSPVPGGGIMIDLQGRFQSPLIATVDETGKLRVGHIEDMREPSE